MRRSIVRVALAAALTLVSFAPHVVVARALNDHPLAQLRGRWDVTFTGHHARRAGWFEVRLNDRNEPRVAFQGPWGAVEAATQVSFNGDWLEFRTPTFGTFRGRYGHHRIRSIRSLGSDAIGDDWVAVRAPELPTHAIHWGDSVRLFDGTTLRGWHGRSDAPLGWLVRDGAMTVAFPSNDLVSNERYRDFKLHLQYRLEPNGDSGVHLRGRYEVQLTDRQELVGERGATGSIYGHLPPIASAEKPAGEWNSLDVKLVGREVTVMINHVTVQDHAIIPGITGDAVDSDEGAPGPIVLQGHIGGVSFRDVVITPGR